jgi:hypothetical protein
MATITQLKSGRLQVKVRRHGITKYETASTRPAAEARARKGESETERDVWRPSTEAERTTIADLLKGYGGEKARHKGDAVQGPSITRLLLADSVTMLTLARTRSVDVAALLARWQEIGHAQGRNRRHAVGACGPCPARRSSAANKQRPCARCAAVVTGGGAAEVITTQY